MAGSALADREDVAIAYSIDGGPTLIAFATTVDEDGSFTYTLEGGSSYTVDDPILFQWPLLAAAAMPLKPLAPSLNVPLTGGTRSPLQRTLNTSPQPPLRGETPFQAKSTAGSTRFNTGSPSNLTLS